VESDPVREMVLSQSVWSGVAGIPPPTLQEKRAYVGRPLGQPAARCVFLCRMIGCRTRRSLRLDDASASVNVVPARAKFLLFGRRLSWS
jgi:hypothetical protein